VRGGRGDCCQSFAAKQSANARRRCLVSLTPGAVRQGHPSTVEVTMHTTTSLELATLPAAAARYLAFALPLDHPHVTRARIVQKGEFALAPDSWHPFRAVQRVTLHPPGFAWDAMIRIAGILGVRVRDAYRDGRGSVDARLLGLVPLVRQAGTPQIAIASLQRWLAEAPWMPTALLPRDGLAWMPIDELTARATVRDGPVSASVDFHIDTRGAITRVTTERYRLEKGKAVLTPWVGRFADYRRVNGVMVPMRSEVEWILPDGARPYWRGRIVSIDYQSSPPDDIR
jgi:hypothetical protein